MKKNLRRNFLILIGIGIVICASILIYLFIKNLNANKETVINKTENVDTIEKYGYNLEDRDSTLFKEIFLNLKDSLSVSEIDYQKYAEYLSELYIIDLYSIDNKINQYDVGALEYVLPDIKDNFELKVKDTLYKYVEDNSDDKRKQDLPEVSSIEVKSVTDTSYKYNDQDYESYEIELNWEYYKDLGYDTEATVVLIKSDDILYVVEQK